MNDDQFDAAVAEAVAAASAEQKLSALERLRKSVLSERRVLRVLTIVSIIGASAAIWLGLTARSALEEFRANRTDARVVSCESYNTDVVDRINGILLAAGAANPQRVEALLLPHRDCTESGIADYFDGDPATDPFEPVTIPEEDQ